MPTSPADHRHAAGLFNNRGPVLPPTARPHDTHAIRRVQTGPHALAALLLVANATGASTAPPPSTRVAPVVPPTRVACRYAEVSLPGVMHGAAGLLRNPVSALVADVRYAVNRGRGGPCPPPLGAGLRALLQVGDAMVGAAELAAMGPRGASAIQLAGSALELGAEAMEQGTLDPGTVMDVLQAQAGLRLDSPPDHQAQGAADADAAIPAVKVAAEAPRAAQGPRLAIAQTTVALRGGRVRVRLDGTDLPLSISDGRLWVRTDVGDVAVRWDTTTWQWTRIPAAEPGPAADARADSSIRLFDPAAAQVRAQAPLDNVRLRLDLLGPDGILYYHDPATGQGGNAVCVDGRYYAATVEPPQGLRIGTLALERRDGFYEPRLPERRSVAARCRRTPEAACAPRRPQFSVGLSRIFRQHHARALSAEQARHRGIVPDPARPGWHLSRRQGRLRQYLQFSGRYFRVRTRQLDAYTQRLSVYLPRAMARVAQRIADIQQSLTAHEHRLMTQAEFNVEYRGMSSLEAAQVYESAVQHIGGLRLTQLQRATIRSYLLRRRSVDEFLQAGGILPPVFSDAAQVVTRINRGLARIPPHPGRVYAALAVDARQLVTTGIGQTLYSEGFLVASGDRGRAVAAVAREAEAAQGEATLVTLDMHQHAHPTGLISLQDEAQVLIGNRVLFRVVARSPGELHLEELGPARQAVGTLGAQALRSVPLRA